MLLILMFPSILGARTKLVPRNVTQCQHQFQSCFFSGHIFIFSYFLLRTYFHIFIFSYFLLRTYFDLCLSCVFSKLFQLCFVHSHLFPFNFHKNLFKCCTKFASLIINIQESRLQNIFFSPKSTSYQVSHVRICEIQPQFNKFHLNYTQYKSR